MNNNQDFIIKDGVLTRYAGPGGDVAIPAGVTEIGESAFSGRTGLACVSIPEGVAEIGQYAFSGCTGLTGIFIPKSVTEIGESAFSGCTGLTIRASAGSYAERYAKEADIGFEAVREYPAADGRQDFLVEDGVLTKYIGLDRSVSIPEDVTEIGAWAFSGCIGLADVAIPEGVTRIGPYAFYKCALLTTLPVPESVTEINEGAFHSCPYLTIRAPEGSYAERYAREAGIRFEATPRRRDET